MSDKTIISPIAVDLGAKNTGVYMPQYTKGAKLTNIKDKSAHTLSFDKNKLTLMMADRTAVRHQRRGHDRRQQAKRLARLVLTNCFGFDFEKHQEAISFLLNRRGRILGDDIDQELLSHVPAGLCSIARRWANSQKDSKLARIFPQVTKDAESVDLTNRLEELGGNIYKDEESEKVAREICESLHNYKNLASRIKRIKKDLKSNTGKASVKKLKDELNKAEKEILLYKDENNLRINIFDFTNKYDAEKIPEAPADDADSKGAGKYYPYIIWNIYKVISETLNNKETGHTLREIYFDHLKHDLDKIGGGSVPDKEPESITYKLENLVAAIAKCKGLHQKEEHRIDVFLRVIGNISNIQLRGMRKYFNNPKHKSGDIWLPEEFDKCYWRWVKSLRPKNDMHRGNIKNIIDAFKEKDKGASKESAAVHLLQTLDPEKTIPPFENQNNRRPPECRSLVLKPYELDKHFHNWRDIVKELINFYKDNDPTIYAEWKEIIKQELQKFAENKLSYKKLLNKTASSKQGKDKCLEENSRKCWGIKEKQDALYCRSLQFLLDVSLAHQEDHFVLRHIMPYGTESTQISDSDKYRLLSKALGKNIDALGKLCRKYYQEIRNSMAGTLV